MQVDEKALLWSEVTSVVGVFLTGKIAAWMNGKVE